MIKIDAIVNEDKMEDIKDALQKLKVNGMTISQVMGCGTQMGYREKIRGYDVDINVLPKVKFEIVVSSQEWADRTIDAICKCAHTGEHGDGKIFVYELADNPNPNLGTWAQSGVGSRPDGVIGILCYK